MTQYLPIIDLSTLNGSNGFRLDGIGANDFSGFSVASAGDVNGDGFTDILIGAKGGDPGGNSLAGESYVVFGQASGFAAALDLSTLDGTNGFRLDGVVAGEYSGTSVASAGDVNGDGFDDIIIGASDSTPGGEFYAGVSYVVFGKATGFAAALDLSTLDGTNGFRLDGIDAYDHSGFSLASAGDVNGDGFDDILIGAPFADPSGNSDAGESYVVFGKASGFAATFDLSTLDGSNGFRLDGVDAADYSGLAVASAGDVNGDGFADIVIGARFASPAGDSFAGESFVVFGKATGFAAAVDLSTLDGSNGFRLDGIEILDFSGVSVASAGDVNGDGFADILIGAYGGDSVGGADAGQTFVLFGQASGFAAALDLSTLDGVNGFRVDGIDASDESGFSVASAGDFNGDGFDDILIGARGADPGGDAYAGESYVVFGQASGFAAAFDLSTLDGNNGFRLDGVAALDASGHSVSAAGDVNGDGFADIMIGAYGGDPGGNSYAGESYVVFGSRPGEAVSRTGTAIANRINGGDFGDTLNGLGGDDTLIGWDGIDTLNGGTGADDMSGGDNNDTYVVDEAGDVVTEAADEGSDTVQSGLSFSIAALANLENITLIGTAANATGNTGANTLVGNDEANILDGGGGADDMSGGGGDDTYVVDEAGDITTESSAVGGTDLVQSAVTRTLGANLENLTLTGGLVINGIGNSLANTLIGNNVANTLNGGAGSDDMSGGDGDDIYVVDDAGDTTSETSALGGTDLVHSSVTRTLGANLENLTLTGGLAINGTGNSLVNTLTGNSAANILNGAAGADDMSGGDGNDTYVVDEAGDVVTEAADEGSDTVQSAISFSIAALANLEHVNLTGTAANATGNDGANTLIGNGVANILNGGLGADDMSGGDGNDTYVVDEAGDVVTEAADEGSDTVQSAITFSIAALANVEHITLTGTAVNATGNAGANTLIGNGSANTLDGGLGADDMSGGDGSDIYVVDEAGDVVTEATDEGSDTVQSAITFSIAALANVEHITLTGTAADATGNDGANTLIGNGSANTLDGGLGVDDLDGGLGDDVLRTDAGLASGEAFRGGGGTDTLEIMKAGSGADSLVFYSQTMTSIEKLIFASGGTGGSTSLSFHGSQFGGGGLSASLEITGNAAVSEFLTIELSDTPGASFSMADFSFVNWSDTIFLNGAGGNETLTGSSLADTINGGGGADTLNGGGGADFLEGGDGDDVYIVDGDDFVSEISSTGGIDTVRSSATHTLGANLEKLTLTGGLAIDGTGNALSNLMIGNALANTLNGLGGVDDMRGGGGNDTYIVNSTVDLTTETSAADGVDLVRASVTRTLGANLENLTLTGSNAIDGVGNALANILNGNAFANVLSGADGADKLVGFNGGDTLRGGLGFDRLTGGNGADKFVFDVAPAFANRDRITDFNLVGDTIQLDDAVFAGIGALGALAAGAFHIGANAHDASDRIIYNAANGKLLFDADGTGAGAQIHFATLDAGLALTAADFVVI